MQPDALRGIAPPEGVDAESAAVAGPGQRHADGSVHLPQSRRLARQQPHRQANDPAALGYAVRPTVTPLGRGHIDPPEPPPPVHPHPVQTDEMHPPRVVDVSHRPEVVRAVEPRFDDGLPVPLEEPIELRVDRLAFTHTIAPVQRHPHAVASGRRADGLHDARRRADPNRLAPTVALPPDAHRHFVPVAHKRRARQGLAQLARQPEAEAAVVAAGGDHGIGRLDRPQCVDDGVAGRAVGGGRAVAVGAPDHRTQVRHGACFGPGQDRDVRQIGPLPVRRSPSLDFVVAIAIAADADHPVPGVRERRKPSPKLDGAIAGAGRRSPDGVGQAERRLEVVVRSQVRDEDAGAGGPAAVGAFGAHDAALTTSTRRRRPTRGANAAPPAPPPVHRGRCPPPPAPR